jgi:hypothetical protein
VPGGGAGNKRIVKLRVSSKPENPSDVKLATRFRDEKLAM